LIPVPDTSSIQPAPPAPAPPEECWRRIGVFGNGTCRELATHVHCRNCPVYAHAGAALLDRTASPEYRREWAMHYAVAKKRIAPANASATLFRIGAEWLALDTALFQEVAENRPMHSLPHRRLGVVLGLVNVRGELLLCVSLGRLLELGRELPPRQPREGYHRLLVVSAESHRFAFPVDEVFGVHRFNREELQEPPATVARAARSFTRGVFRWRQHTVGCLDAEVLFLHLQQNLS
jgi:chemotaxis-related protein WspD